MWSLQQVGFTSAATMDTGNIPTDFYTSLLRDKTIVLAFDSDRAGETAIRKNKEKLGELGFSKVRVAIPPEGKDWNDLLAEGALNPERLNKTIQDAKFRGQLFDTTNPNEYIRVLYEWKGRGAEEFRNIFSLNQKLYEASKEGDDFKIELLADASIKAPYKVIAENGDHSFVVIVETADKVISIDVGADLMTNIKNSMSWYLGKRDGDTFR